MNNQYNSQVSYHYAAYRPPLHDMILASILSQDGKYECAIDVGCGTGLSTVALSPYCKLVYGVEPSEAMLAKTTDTDGIQYLSGTGDAIPLPDHLASLVTFAGSLFYAKSDALIVELQRLCKPKAKVVAYDFEVQLQAVMKRLGIELEMSEGGYDHAINFSDSKAFQELFVNTETLQLEVSAKQLAHILFSSAKRFHAFTMHFGETNTFELVQAKLEEISHTHKVEIDTYSSVYLIK
ncbi:methyltransferase [Photobacterium jeanii]|uniref:Methyltransferase n=1 Tax=Photobacterium jeanii TaxID=858640 RepID=A0A178K4G7_9GAMM|nr:class I SAM-dependent methyltransferase [Photobacterium jeanii]OAN11634.1 methyltransferase [Photobacterium jeanii]PST91156.1 class I SAM-dependent methyltransferase [Photobacterium jeanii]